MEAYLVKAFLPRPVLFVASRQNATFPTRSEQTPARDVGLSHRLAQYDRQSRGEITFSGSTPPRMSLAPGTFSQKTTFLVAQITKHYQASSAHATLNKSEHISPRLVSANATSESVRIRSCRDRLISSRQQSRVDAGEFNLS